MKEIRRRVVRGRERPRRVGHLLRIETAEPAAHRLSCDGIKELRRIVARSRERPSRVGQLLLLETAQPTAHRLS